MALLELLSHSRIQTMAAIILRDTQYLFSGYSQIPNPPFPLYIIICVYSTGVTFEIL